MKARSAWIAGLVLALLIAAMLSPWASRLPDGLDRVAESLGFSVRQRKEPLVSAPLPDYKVPGARDAPWSTPAAGVVGTLAVFGMASLAGYALRRRGSR